MIVGQTSRFAIESKLSEAYERPSFIGLGYFLIHINGLCYGVRDPRATMLACSLEKVNERLARAGDHRAFFSMYDASHIATAFRDAFFGSSPDISYLGMPADTFGDVIASSRIQWAPDGDEAFDDGSYVLQFDVGDRVRLIAFRSADFGQYDPSSLREQWLPLDEFYSTLQLWKDRFLQEWTSTAKVAEIPEY